MRLVKPVELDRISQVLVKGACPICAFLKNDQSSLLRGEMVPDEITCLCNFHAWALAGSVDKINVAQIFLNVLQQEPEGAGQSSTKCSVCERLLQREVLHIRELLGNMNTRLVLDWMKHQGTFCRRHGEHIRELAPSQLRAVIDEILDRSASSLRTGLNDVLRHSGEGQGSGGGVLGHAAEFLVCQRGIQG